MTNNPHSEKKLLVAMELSNSKWLLAFTDGDKIRRKSIDARDRGRFLSEVARAKEKLGFEPDASVLCCYEAGRDGFWIYRWLISERLECLVVDPASIEVNRRSRRAKTDRLDAESLARLLLRYEGGESKVWSVVRVPTTAQEDEMRLHRELERLKKERTAHLCRVKSLLVARGIVAKGNLAGLKKQLGVVECWNKEPLPADVQAELGRELDRLDLLSEQVRDLERQRKQRLAKPVTNADHQASDLNRLYGVGEVSSWTLAKEFFGWREFRNRREVGALAGLAPTPYNSGGSVVEQGISKAGNRRIRRVMVELAWSWLRFQPESELTHWFMDRYAGGGKRMRRIGIVALARKLLVALWKYVEFGEVPKGAIVR
ncbi:IS110 family transposase [Pontiellaceae bacterium B12219]|nr:IS110 family transposase [Pontiellaceae bacterium B12219]